MKFRAKMYDPPVIKEFYNILSSIPKGAGSSKVSTMRLTQDEVYFIYVDSGCPASTMWCNMKAEYYFSDYILEGVTNEEPEIYLEIPHSLMSQSLSNVMKTSVNSVKCVKVKLTRKFEHAYLSFVIDMAGNRQCIQDIPVAPIPRRDWSDFSEPFYDMDNEEIVRLNVRDIKKLKHYFDRYKNIGKFARLTAHQSGLLEMQLETAQAKLITRFKDLTALGNTSALKDPNGLVKVCIDLKKLSGFLAADHTGIQRCVVSFINDKMLHLCLVKDEMCLQHYFPAYKDE